MTLLTRIGLGGALLISTFTFGCAPGYSSSATSLALNNSGSDPGSTATPAPADTSLGICSRLDFSDITWPIKLLSNERKALALAFNITGSYEGNAGWTNLSNNFDGQGISLGLNQQNLGQGSLQPLLLDILKNNLGLAQKTFSTTNLSSMTKMLNAYAQTNVSSLDFDAGFEISNEELFPHKVHLSPLDIMDANDDSALVTIRSTKTDASVAWAKANLFLSNGTSFKTEWKNSFVTLAASAPYRSLQVNAAFTMFSKAIAYFDAFKFRELRSLLLMYDFVVQNGSFSDAHSKQFSDFDKLNPKASETTRLLKLLAIRVTTVRPEYQNDVIARKSAIINGTGVVHGTTRNLPKEYCYKPGEIL